jgi:outer membrane protein TolC
MKRIVLSVMIFFTSTYSQKLMTAEDAIRLGLENNFDIQIARNTVEIAENNVGKGTANFLPLLDANGFYQNSSTDLETDNPFRFGGKSTTRTYNSQVALNWTLFDGFRMFVNRNRYVELAKLSDAQAQNIIENIGVSILGEYFDVVQQEQLMDVARQALEISETRLNKEKVRRDLGGASSTDLLNAQVSFNNDKATLINQELRLKLARKDLNILLAQKPNSPVNVRKEITIPDLDLTLENLQSLAMERNSTLMIARQNKIVAEKNIKLARSNFLPDIFFNASYGYTDQLLSLEENQRQDVDFPGEITTQSTDGIFGFTLTFNLFNGFRDKIDMQNARIEKKNQELALKNALNSIAGLVQEKYETFNKRVELILLEEENVVAAEANLRLQQDRYQIGTATSLEFRDAQVNLIRAQTTLIVARYQARITRLEIEQLIGRYAIN